MQLSPRTIRHRRIRARVSGTATRPRLAVYRSNRHIYAQLIDDTVGVTRVASSDERLGKDAAGKPLSERAQLVGKDLADRAREAGIATAVFDRGGYLYHGAVAAVADGARQGGLSF